MEGIDVKNLADNIIQVAQYDVEQYSSVAKIMNSFPLDQIKITSGQLKDSMASLETLRSSHRFLALAHSTVVSLCDLCGIEKQLQGEFWILHATFALNLNVADVGQYAALKAIEFLKGENELALAKAYSLVATASRNLGDHPSAITNYGLAKQFAQSVGDHELATWQVFRLGKMYVNYLQQPSRGVEYLTNAKTAFQNLNTLTATRGSAACLDQLGDVYRQTTINLDRAERLYHEAMALNQSLSNKRGIARNIAHLGICAENRMDYSRARELLEESVRLTREIVGQDRGTAIRLGQLAKICIQGEDLQYLEYAEQCLEEATDLCKRYREFKYMAKHEICWGMLYRKMRDYQKAKPHFENAIELGKKYLLFEVEADAYDQLAEMFSIDFEDYMQAQKAVLASTEVRTQAWTYISRNNPELEEVENKIEIAFMYKSLFEKLLVDSVSDFNRSIDAIRQAYDLALKESQAKYNNISLLFQAGALMTGIKHEALNLINEIASSISQLLKDNSIDESARQALQTIREKSLMGLELLRGPVIQSLLSARSLERAPVSARGILAPIFEWIEKENKEYGIKTFLTERIPSVRIVCEPTVLRLIIGIVVQNARESFRELAERIIRISVYFRMAENKLCIEITDTGPGMDKQQLKDALQVGYTTKPGHTGLGLPTVRFLLEPRGGQVDVNSKVGVGTTVTLLVPTK